MNWKSCRNILVLICVLSALARKQQPLRNRLRGGHLRAVVGQVPAISVINRNSSGHVIGYSGLVVYQFDWLSRRLHFTYDLIPASENSPGYLVNGTWKGMIGQITRGEVDVSLGPFALSWQRYDAMEFVGLLGGSGSTLMVKYPTTRFSAIAVLEPFEFNTWLAWLFSLLLVLVAGTIFMFLRARIYDYKSPAAASYGNLVLYIVGTTVSQGNYFRARLASIWLLLATWCFAAFVFVNVYSSMLTSSLSAKYKAPEINSMKELAANTHFQIMTIKGSVPEIDLLRSRVSYLQVVAERLQKCHDCRPELVDTIKEHVIKGGCVGFVATSIAAAVVQSDFKKSGRCRLTMANVQYMYLYTYYGMSKTSPYVEEINRESLWAIAHGLNAKWNSNPDSSGSQCLLQYNSKGVAIERSSFPIRLKQLYAAFVILLTGYAVSAVFFIGELVVRKVRSLHITVI